MKLLLTCIAVLAGLSAPASAQSSRDYRASGDYRVITACSSYGKGCISGPTRPARFGAEVRLPGGTWVACARSCRETLSNETVDFWAKRDAERGGGGYRRR